MPFKRSQRELAQAVDELVRKVDAGMRRPALIIFDALADIRRLRFRSPEEEARVALQLREQMPGLEKSLFSEEQTKTLARGLEVLKRQLSDAAKSPGPRT